MRASHPNPFIARTPGCPRNAAISGAEAAFPRFTPTPPHSRRMPRGRGQRGGAPGPSRPAQPQRSRGRSAASLPGTTAETAPARAGPATPNPLGSARRLFLLPKPDKYVYNLGLKEQKKTLAVLILLLLFQEQEPQNTSQCKESCCSSLVLYR